MSDVPTVTSAEVGGFRIDSNSGASKQDIETALAPPAPPGEEKPDEKPDPSKAASELGKLGGKASAEKRAAEAKEAEKAEKKAAKEAKAEGDEATGSEVEAKAEDEKPKDEKPLGKPRDDPRARMLEATRKEAEAKRERDAVKAELERVKAEVETLKRTSTQADKPSIEAKVSDQDPEPDETGYEDYKTWLRDWTAWNHRQLTAKDRQENERRSREAAIETSLNDSIDKLAERVGPVREKLSDDVLSLKSSFALMAENQRDGTNRPETARHWIMNEFIFSPEMDAPALMLYLSEHTDEFQRIATLTTPRAVSRALAKIEARLEAVTAGNGSESDEEVSKAAPPVKPVTGAPYSSDANVEYKPGMSFDEYMAKHRKRSAASR